MHIPGAGSDTDYFLLKSLRKTLNSGWSPPHDVTHMLSSFLFPDWSKWHIWLVGRSCFIALSVTESLALLWTSSLRLVVCSQFCSLWSYSSWTNSLHIFFSCCPNLCGYFWWSVNMEFVPLVFQNRPSVITCAPANNRNCNLSHCPVSHNGCSALTNNYRRVNSE